MNKGYFAVVDGDDDKHYHCYYYRYCCADGK